MTRRYFSYPEEERPDILMQLRLSELLSFALSFSQQAKQAEHNPRLSGVLSHSCECTAGHSRSHHAPASVMLRTDSSELYQRRALTRPKVR